MLSILRETIFYSLCTRLPFVPRTFRCTYRCTMSGITRCLPVLLRAFIHARRYTFVKASSSYTIDEPRVRHRGPRIRRWYKLSASVTCGAFLVILRLRETQPSHATLFINSNVATRFFVILSDYYSSTIYTLIIDFIIDSLFRSWFNHPIMLIRIWTVGHNNFKVHNLKF